MKKNIFAICDLEADYARSFAQYLSRRKNLPFEIQAFTSSQALEAFAEKQRIELLLISAKALTPRIGELGITKIIVLSEGNPQDEIPGLTCVYKYQASAQILQEAMSAYSETNRQAQLFPVLKKSTTIYGIYSPAGGCGKTSLALALAAELAKARRVLFLSLEGCSGLPGMQDCTHTLSDLFYFARQKDENLIHRMNAVIRTEDGVDFIPPVRLCEDIHQASWEDLGTLIRTILTHSTYEALVIDVGQEFQETLELLSRCQIIYMPVRPDGLGLSKLRQFEDMLTMLEAVQIAERIRRVTPPAMSSDQPTDEYVRGLVWGPWGELARQLLMSE